MEHLQTTAQLLGISLTQAQLDQFSGYFEALVSWNESVNLTGITEKDEVVTKHFLDSLTIVPYLPKLPFSMIDIGTGAGFPGIPVRIVVPESTVTLLEAVGKKVNFLEHIIKTLELENITAHQGRAEDFGHDPKFRGQFDIVTGRAVAHLSVLAEYALPFLKVGGRLIAQKMDTITGEEGKNEITDTDKALAELGGRVKGIVAVTAEGLKNRNIIIIEKISDTPSKYPRRAGVPSKRPL
ncbi:MAG: 16S rRNA (guanine(527)-N(7))-methyltransferase RsmG [bacterium]|nr:16S rRNA (guanine(527)-N(7))-methyltransferase RsmG [bacterium]